MGDVEEIVLEGQVGNVSHVKVSVGVCSRLRGGAGQVDLRFLYVDAVHLARLDRPGQPHCHGPWTAAEVQHFHPGFEVRNQVPGMGFQRTAVQQLAKLLAVPHRVGLGSIVWFGHGFFSLWRVSFAIYP